MQHVEMEKRKCREARAGEDKNASREKFSTDLRPGLHRLKGTTIDRLQEGGKSCHSMFF